MCRHDPDNFAEDVEMGNCLSNLNVTAMDTRDSKGRGGDGFSHSNRTNTSSLNFGRKRIFGTGPVFITQ